MQSLYELLRTPTVANLKFQSIDFFDQIIEKYPDEYEKIITYINQCFNYNSPYLIDEKDWGIFLLERFAANEIDEEIRPALMNYESTEIVYGIAAFLAYQKQSTWTTLVAKQNLRISMLATIQGHSASINDKKNANELVTSLDLEINQIMESMKQDQKRFGNFKGFEDVKAAKIRHVINVAYFID
jgi:hypothetical protein